MERDLVNFFASGSERETKLQRINCFYRAAAKRTSKMQRLREQGWYPSNSEALKPVMTVNNGVLLELDATNPGLRSEMA